MSSFCSPESSSHLLHKLPITVTFCSKIDHWNFFPQEEEEADDANPLNFPFLTDDRCIQFIKNSKVIFMLRGLPGSGKSTVAKQIKQVYGDLAFICSADDFRMTDSGEYFWKPEEYDMSHLECEEKARQACNNERPVVIIGIHQLQFYVTEGKVETMKSQHLW